MSRFLVLSAAALLALGCMKGAERTDTMQTATMSAAINLDEVAGTWNFNAIPEGDTTVVNYTVMATNDTSGWTMKMGNAAPVPLRITVAGDSVITMAGPFPSALKPGTTVTTHSITRFRGDSAFGVTHAAYSGGERLTLQTRGSRAP